MNATKSITALLLSLVAFVHAEAQQAIPKLTDETVLAETARAKVTKGDLDVEVSRLPEKDVPDMLSSATRLGTLVENILVNKTLAAEARKSGLDRDPKVQRDIEMQIDRVLAKHRSQEILRTAPEIDLQGKARQEYLVNTHRFKVPANYRLWHTLVRFDATSKTQARIKAEKIREEVVKGGDIQKIAKEFSDDPTASRSGGVNVAVPIASVNPPIAKAIEKLKTGDVAPVIEVADGFFVVKIVEILPERTPKFDEIKPDLIQDARVTYLSTHFENYIAAIKSDSTLKTNVDALEAIRKPYLPNLELIKPPAPTKQ
jgi:peptidyl-prolyl cis-trans isomerase C